MTPREAQEIVKLGTGNEMPFLMQKALSFALFKVSLPSLQHRLTLAHARCSFRGMGDHFFRRTESLQSRNS